MQSSNASQCNHVQEAMLLISKELLHGNIQSQGFKGHLAAFKNSLKLSDHSSSRFKLAVGLRQQESLTGAPAAASSTAARAKYGAGSQSGVI